MATKKNSEKSLLEKTDTLDAFSDLDFLKKEFMELKKKDPYLWIQEYEQNPVLTYCPKCNGTLLKEFPLYYHCKECGLNFFKEFEDDVSKKEEKKD